MKHAHTGEHCVAISRLTRSTRCDFVEASKLESASTAPLRPDSLHQERLRCSRESADVVRAEIRSLTRSTRSDFVEAKGLIHE